MSAVSPWSVGLSIRHLYLINYVNDQSSFDFIIGRLVACCLCRLFLMFPILGLNFVVIHDCVALHTYWTPF